MTSHISEIRKDFAAKHVQIRLFWGTGINYWMIKTNQHLLQSEKCWICSILTVSRVHLKQQNGWYIQKQTSTCMLCINRTMNIRLFQHSRQIFPLISSQEKAIFQCLLSFLWGRRFHYDLFYFLFILSYFLGSHRQLQ